MGNSVQCLCSNCKYIYIINIIINNYSQQSETASSIGNKHRYYQTIHTANTHTMYNHVITIIIIIVCKFKEQRMLM